LDKAREKMPHLTQRLLMTIANIERGAHGVLNKNNFSAKIFISRFYNYLSQKISCGRGIIFARGAHFHAKGREAVFFKNLIRPDIGKIGVGLGKGNVTLPIPIPKNNSQEKSVLIRG
jgi:hypothetical protein